MEDEQLKNRFLLCNPEEAEDHKQDVAEFQKENIQKGILQPIKLTDFPVLKVAFRRVINETKNKRVLIPFDWKWHYEEDSRLQPFFGAILMTSAKIHHRQRPQTDDVIIATLEDYYIAKLIFETVIEQTSAGVKEGDLEIYNHVPEVKEEKAKRSKIAEEAGVSTSTARYALERLVDADLVNSTQEDSGNRAYLYWKTENEPAQVAIELVQTSITSDSIKEKLEEFLEVCMDISYIEGVGSSNFDFSDITHLTPSYMRNLIQTLSIEKEDAKQLFGDFKACMDNFATYTAFELEEEETSDNGEENKVSQSELKDQLADLLNEERPKVSELQYHFDPEDLPRIQEMLLNWKEEGKAKIGENNRWRLN